MDQGGPITPPTDDGAPVTRPTCWKCGYALTGLRVDSKCPECGTPIWGPRMGSTEGDRLAGRILSWGIASLCLTFALLGPLAALLTVPAFAANRKFRALVEAGGAAPSQVRCAKAGTTCARIAVAASMVYLGLFLALIFGGL